MKKNVFLTSVACALALSWAGCGQTPVADTADAGPRVVDAGFTPVDAGGVAASDSGTQPVDAGPMSVDSGTGLHDAGAGAADGGAPLNGCTEGRFIDSTALTNTNVAFGGGLGEVYSPACVTIAAGRTVTFKGAFSSHNLLRGSPSNLNAGSANNPIPEVTTGSEKIVTFATVGDYPYICQFHNPSGMMGVVRVR